MRNLTIALGLLIFGLAGFYGGAKFENGKQAATPTGAVVAGAGTTGTGAAGATGAGRGTAGTGAAGGNGAAGGAGGFGRGTFGQVTAISGDTLTIQDAQGNQIKVQLQPTTSIVKTVTGARTDLATGVTVTVGGQRASDGSVTATTVTIVPAGSLPGTAPSPRG